MCIRDRVSSLETPATAASSETTTNNVELAIATNIRDSAFLLPFRAVAMIKIKASVMPKPEIMRAIMGVIQSCCSALSGALPLDTICLSGKSLRADTYLL